MPKLRRPTSARPSDAALDRRDLLALSGLAAAALASQAQATPAAETRKVTLTQGTNIAVTVAPDGRSIAMDLLGIIWTVPIAGGPAFQVTDALTDGAQPDWTPDGKRLVFQSYRDGNFHIWSVARDGTGLTQLTHGPYDCREPRVSPDGRAIAFASDETGRYAIHVISISGGPARLWSKTQGQACQPAWSPDGARIAYAVDRARIEVVDAVGTTTTPISLKTPAEIHSPSFTLDGKDIAFTVIENGKAELRTARTILVTGQDVFPFRATWVATGAANGDMFYAADGEIRRRTTSGTQTIAFSAVVPVARPHYTKKARDFDTTRPRPVVGIGSPAASPDGKSLVFRALNDLWLLPTTGGKPTPLIKDSFWKCDPAWSPDGKTLAYSTDRGGSLQIWLRDMATGQTSQLTRHTGAALSSAWSRDGRQIAFLDQTGALHTVQLADATTRQIFPAIWEPGKPSWGPGDKTLALAAFKPYSARYREGLSEILTVDVATGAASYQPHAPHKSLGTRGDDGPVWSPDGTKLAYAFASRLWVVAVDAQGKFQASPRALNTEVTDAPIWAGDSLIYLSAGKLRRVSLDGAAQKTIPLDFHWANAKPTSKTVVRAARLWDGRADGLRENLDLVILANRISDIVPAGQGPADAKLIIANAGQTVMPGLIEMHAHRQMQGYAYGDREGRLWLSLGVTTTRSPGSPAYHMVEDRESLDSGARIGPRYFATGEAIDGSRIYYNFMRPVTEPGQMALELQRAQALAYDLIKAYVRLPAAAQRDLITWAHAHGMPVTSHYHYPSLAFGIDGMEHMGATNRFGFSRTTSALGISYQDVAALFAAAGTRLTPTLFTAAALYAQDRSLIDDPRIKALFPPWEYARLAARADQPATAAGLASLARNVAHLRTLIAAGGQVVTGTDSPIDSNGVSLHMNLRAMVKFGMSPLEALTTATRNAGDYLGQPVGTLERGKLADLSVIDGNPLNRIEDAAAVSLVMKNGETHTPTTLMAPFSTIEHTSNLQPEPYANPSPLWWHQAEYVESGRAACCADPFRVTPSTPRVFRAIEV